MSNSKDFLGFDSIFSIKNILQCLKFPLVSAAVIRENIPCLRSDGSMGQMEICKDEFGNRIDCPKYHEDVTENNEEEEEKGRKKPCRQYLKSSQSSTHHTSHISKIALRYLSTYIKEFKKN